MQIKMGATMMQDEKSKLPILAGVAFALAIIAALILVAPIKPSPVPVVNLPTPNGYDTLAEAGEMVAGIPDDYDTTTDADSLRACLQTNAKSIELIDQAMTQECVVPVDYDKGRQGVDEGLNALGNIRQSMRLLMIKAKLAELEGDLAAAAIAQSELFLHSERTTNEGLLIHVQVSLAYRKSALESLKRLAPQLSSDQKKTTQATLQSQERRRIDVDDIRMREEVIYTKDFGFGARLQMRRLRKIAAPAYAKTKAQSDMSELLFDEVNVLLSK